MISLTETYVIVLPIDVLPETLQHELEKIPVGSKLEYANVNNGSLFLRYTRVVPVVTA